jgi:SNF2 family DNA or RNA helicase
MLIWSQAIVQQTTLRRTKEMKDEDGKPLVALPPLTYYHHKVKLDPEARKVYQEIENAVKIRLQVLMKEGNASKQWSTVLAFITRLRQVACDPSR